MEYNVNRKPFVFKLTHKAIASFPALDSRLRGNDVLYVYVFAKSIALKMIFC
jgi:hypothetical protein